MTPVYSDSIDRAVEDFRKRPHRYGGNKWRCYDEVKVRLQLVINPKTWDYRKHIEYLAERLGL